MNPKISIVVPVYNAEMYLARCIDSIICQTYKNIELILINDGSTDRSGQICDEYAQKDTRIIVVHKKNAGVSEARNDGIKLSSGIYLQFVDSDDYIDKNMTEILIDVALLNESDIVMCGFKTIDYKTGESIPLCYSRMELDLDFKGFLTIYDDLFLKRYLNTSCNKLFKAGLIKDNQIYFEPDLDYGEDLIFNLEVCKRCNKFSIINSCLCNYVAYDNNDSLSRKCRTNMYEIKMLLFNQTIAMYADSDNYTVQINNLKEYFTRELINAVVQYYASHTSLKDYKRFQEKTITVPRDEVFEKRIISVNSNSKRERLLVFFLRNNMYLSLYFYVQIREFLRNRFPRIFTYLKKIGGENDAEN